MIEETWAEKVARLQHEIAVRQLELEYLVLGDKLSCVSAPVDVIMPIDTGPHQAAKKE